MAIYTYDQFEQAAKNSGLYGQFSSADLSLAQQNPDAGMSLLKYKQDFANATTAEARALANQGAEQIRSSYGNYVGGADGSGFSLTQLSPSSFTPSTAAPTYTNRYDDTITSMLDKLTNRQDFSYDSSTDPLYSQYRKAYAREGERATQDALGATAAASGGIPSSYAATAASQAGDYYAAQMTDKIPELYQIAYNKYLNDYDMQLRDLETVQNAEQLDYNKYLNELSQYNTDREFDYGKLLDEINSQTLERQETLDNAKYAADIGDYSKLQGLGYDTSAAQRKDALTEAELYAAYGDNSALANLGVDMTNANFAHDFSVGEQYAQYGDYSKLNDLGVDTSNNPTDWERQYLLAQLDAQYGTGSQLANLGITRKPDTVTGSGSGGGGNTDDTGATGDGTKAGLSANDIAAIKAAYGTELSQANWDALLKANPNLSAADLTAAGFSVKSESPEAGTTIKVTAKLEKSLRHKYGDVWSQTTWDQVMKDYNLTAADLKSMGFSVKSSGGNNIASVTDYDSAMSYMKSAGVAAGVRTGMMTRNEWSRRKAAYQNYEQGSTEVTNYDSYEEYIQDYVTYATSK